MPKKPVPPLDDRAKAAYTALYQQLKAEMSPEEFRAFGAKLQAQVVFNRDFSKYKDKPAQYAKDVLKVKLLPKQIEIAEAVLKYPRVMVRSCNGYSKSHTAGSLINFWFDCRVPSITLTTAPTESSVIDILWKEVRTQRRGRPGLSPKAPSMELAPNHYARGYTAKDAASFQGRRERDLLIIMDEACHDDQTEVLTAAGWKLFKNVIADDTLLTMNPRTFEASYVVPKAVHRSIYKGKMFYYDRRGSNFCVTPNHKMFYQRYSPNRKGSNKYTDWSLKEIQDIDNTQYYLKRCFSWNVPEQTQFTLPAFTGERKVWGEKNIPMDDWMEFLGWFYSEGCLIMGNETDNAYSIAITQQDETVLEKLKEMLITWGFEPKIYPSTSTAQLRVHSRQLAAYLQTFGRYCLDKTIPNEVKNASSRQIKIFLDAYRDGDGYERDSHDIIYTSNKVMAGELQELAFKAGYSATVFERQLEGKVNFIENLFATSTKDGFVVLISHSRDRVKIRKEHMQTVDYDGEIFCAEVEPYHLLFTRRDGHCMWSGNSGIPEEFWTAAKAMCTSPDHRWLVLYNPLDSSSFVYTEETNVDSNWHVITLNALEHPNVALELAGQPPLVEAGVRLSWVNQAFKDWATKIESKDDIKPIYDVEWPPASGIWYRPGPEFEARVLGRWPTGSVYSIWNDAVITACETKQQELPKDTPPEIGVDVAHSGLNWTVLYVRWGKSIVYRESRQGVEYAWTANRAKQLADEWGKKAGLDGKRVAIKLDAGGGYGEAVFELREGYNFILINGTSPAIRENNYHNRRSELWFQTFRMAEDGLIEWSRLTLEEKKKLRRQLLSAKYSFDLKNRLQVEEKKKTMKEAGGSPDEADALNLACTNFFRPPPVKKKNAVEPFKDRYKDKGFLDQSRSKDWMMI